MSILFTKSC